MKEYTFNLNAPNVPEMLFISDERSDEIIEIAQKHFENMGLSAKETIIETIKEVQAAYEYEAIYAGYVIGMLMGSLCK